MKLCDAAKLIAVLTTGAGLSLPAAAQEQPDYEALVRVMRECAKIEEMAARASCYDYTFRAERLIAGDAASADWGTTPSTPRSSTRAPEPNSFGAETLPKPNAGEEEASDDALLAVTEARRIEPGIYRLTLDDGGQWLFVDAVPMSYAPPRAGSTIELRRAALGSFQMLYADQRPVRIRRVR